MKLDTVLYILADGIDHEIPIRIDYDAIYVPEQISGPPENCWPASGELTINEVEPIGKLPEGITQQIFDEVAADTPELEDECWEHFHSRGVDDYA